MDSPEMRCTKCKGTMEEGVILDYGHGNYLRVLTWFAGLPEKSYWVGLKVKGMRQLPLRTLRCTACGYLESYAAEPSGSVTPVGNR
jgi:hypothetical protein